MDYEELLDLVFPEEINWKRFKISKTEKIKSNSLKPYKWIITFYIEEKNITPKPLKDDNGDYVDTWNKIISKWFYPEKTINDFPLRNYIAKIILKKRRWIDKNTNKQITSDLFLEYSWTSNTKDLMCFLKWNSRQFSFKYIN